MTDKNKQGIKAAQAGNFEQAERFFLEAFKEVPNNEGIYSNVVRIMLMRGRTVELLALHKKTFTSKNRTLSDPEVILAICESAEKIGRQNDVIEILTLLHNQNKGTSITALVLSEALFKKHQLNQAQKILRHALEGDTNNPSLLTNLAITESELGNYSMAESLYLKVVELRPSEFLGHYNLSKFKLAIGDYKSASRHLTKAEEIVKGTPEATVLRQQIEEALLEGISPLKTIYQSIDAEKWKQAVELLKTYQPEIDRSQWMGAICELPKAFQVQLLPEELCHTKELVKQYPLLVDQNELIESLIEAIRQDPSLTWNRVNKPTDGGSQTHELLAGSSINAIQELTQLIATACQSLLKRKDPIATELISGWGVILKSGGYQRKHIHADAELSGVIYLKTPGKKQGHQKHEGDICFSGDEKLFVKPSPGLMLVFPGYLPHATVPYTSEEERICIAFNLRPQANEGQ